MSRRAWLAFAAMSVIWGVPYLFIKVAVDDGVPPAFLAWVRVVIGAGLLVGVAWRAGILRTVRDRMRWLVAFAVVEIVVPFPLIAAGEQYVDSSVAAIIIATAPLFVALLALRFDATERTGGWRLIGLFVGLGGVVALVGIDFAGEADELLGAAALVAAALGYAAGPMILKRQLADLDQRAVMGAALAVAAVLLAPGAALDPPEAMPSAAALVALAVLGLVCTAAGLVVYGMLVAEAGAGRALIITYVNPVVAVALGIVFLEERPGAGALVGLALILAGSWLATTSTGGAEGDTVEQTQPPGSSMPPEPARAPGLSAAGRRAGVGSTRWQPKRQRPQSTWSATREDHMGHGRG
jgi:drug/metabolite transporter (DMT)-like permease